jgi:hypothetical protein
VLENPIARLLALATDVGTHPAVLHVLSVSLALVAADATRLGARLDQRSRDRRLELDLAGQDLPRGHTHVRAVEIEADAAAKGLHVLLGEARVRTGRAALGAVEACGDAAAEHGGLDCRPYRVRSDHLQCVSH